MPKIGDFHYFLWSSTTRCSACLTDFTGFYEFGGRENKFSRNFPRKFPRKFSRREFSRNFPEFPGISRKFSPEVFPSEIFPTFSGNSRKFYLKVFRSLSGSSRKGYTRMYTPGKINSLFRKVYTSVYYICIYSMLYATGVDFVNTGMNVHST